MPIVPHRIAHQTLRARQAELPAPVETPKAAESDQSNEPGKTLESPPAETLQDPVKEDDGRPTAETSSNASDRAEATTRSTTTPTPTGSSLPTRTTSSTTRASTTTLPSPSRTSHEASTTTGHTTVVNETSHSYIFPNSFPADFPMQTPAPVKKVSSGRGYAFLQHNELADSMLIFAAFLVVSLIASMILIKFSQISSRRQGSKVDQMVGEDMKWQERREVLERKIVYDSARGGGGGAGQRKLKGSGGVKGGGVPGWRELSEQERRR